MAEDRAGGIASFGISFGGQKATTGGGGEAAEEGNQPTLRVVVVAELVAGNDWSTGVAPSLEPIPIDAESFDRVMGQLAPSLAFEVSDPFGSDDPPLRVDLVLRDRKSLRPNEIVQQLPALRALVDARRIVNDVAARESSARSALARS